MAAPGVKTTQQPRSTLDQLTALGLDASALRGTEIKFWHSWTGEAGDAIGELVAEFNTTNEWGITVEDTPFGSYDELGASVEAALEEDSSPELVAAYTYQAQNWNPGEDPLVDLNPYLDLPQLGLSSEEQADFYPAFWENDALDQQRLGVPAQRSAAVIYYNQSWAEQLGFETPPRTPDEFAEQACAAARAIQEDGNPENDQGSGWIISSDYPAVLGWLYAHGAEISQPRGEGYRFDTAEVKNAFRFMYQVNQQGCARFLEDQTAEDEFAQRRGLFAAASITDIPHQLAAFRRAGSRDRWTVIPFPSRQGDAAITSYGPSYIILKSTPREQLAAWLFTRWLASPINQAKIVEATGTLPLRLSTLDYLRTFRPRRSPQWQAALDLLAYTRNEPNAPSWKDVRWALSDAATQLFRWYFTIDQLPATIKLLDQTAAELHRRTQ
jgi:ABC-type glycerol-3-phosphate transport system substrate-binding protein